jgi:hypothetical protein
MDVSALSTGGTVTSAVVRQSPTRCIVQLGPVALTVAWLRSAVDSIAFGQLLIIVWRGMVAPPQDLRPERAAAPRGSRAPATALWEEVLVPDATSADDWRWRSNAPNGGRHTSTELAAHCVARLRVAYNEAATLAAETA